MNLLNEGGKMKAAAEELIDLGTALVVFVHDMAMKLKVRAENGQCGWNTDVYWMEEWRRQFDEHITKVGTFDGPDEEQENLIDIANIAMFAHHNIDEYPGETSRDALQVLSEEKTALSATQLHTTAVQLSVPKDVIECAVRALAGIEALALIRGAFGASLPDAKAILCVIRNKARHAAN